jgi:ABC-2 type transport system permease protein
MVTQLLRLKLRLTANTFRRSPWQVFGLIVAALYGCFLTIFIVSALIAARAASDVDLVRSIVVMAGSLTMLGFAVLPLLLRTDDTLDPRRFSLFGISDSRLAVGLAVAALAGVPSVVLAICSLASIVTWSRNPGSTILALIAAVLATVTCTILARVTTSVAAFLLSSRRARDFGAAASLIVLVLIFPAAILLLSTNWSNDGLRVLHGFAGGLSWTPLGAVWAVPADAANGEVGAPLLKLLIALTFLGVVWLAWRSIVARMLVTPERQASVRSYSGLGWFGSLSRRPIGAIAARSLTYWGRDSRYWVSLLMIPLVPFVAVAALMIAGVSGHIASLLPLPIMCLFLGWSIHNDLAYDSTAVWMHVASGTRGIADRIGRVVPVLFIGVPLVVVGSLVTVAFYGDLAILPAIFGVSTAVLLIGVGLSSITSALFPYPATKPNDSAFAQPQHTGAAASVIQSISFIAILLIASPVIALAILGIADSPEWFPAALLAGIVIGTIVLVGGIAAGAATFNKRGPEILAEAIKAD